MNTMGSAELNIGGQEIRRGFQAVAEAPSLFCVPLTEANRGRFYQTSAAKGPAETALIGKPVTRRRTFPTLLLGGLGLLMGTGTLKHPSIGSQDAITPTPEPKNISRRDLLKAGIGAGALLLAKTLPARAETIFLPHVQTVNKGIQPEVTVTSTPTVTRPTETPTLTPTPEPTKLPDNDLEIKLKEYPQIREGVGPVEVTNTCGYWNETTPGGAPDIPDSIRQFCVHGSLKTTNNPEDISKNSPWNVPYETVMFATEHGHLSISQWASISLDTGQVVYTYGVAQKPKMFESNPEEMHTWLLTNVNVNTVEWAVEIDRDTGHTIIITHFKGVEEDDPDHPGQKHTVDKTFTVPYDVYNEMNDYKPGNRAITVSRTYGSFSHSSFETQFRYKNQDEVKLPSQELTNVTLVHARGGMLTYGYGVMEQIPSSTDPSGPWGVFRFFNRPDYTRGLLCGTTGTDRRMLTDPTNQCWYPSIREYIDNIRNWGWTSPFWRQFRSMLPFERRRKLPDEIPSSTIDYSGLRKEVPEAFNLSTPQGRAEARQYGTNCITSGVSVAHDPHYTTDRPIFVVWDGACDSPDWKKAYQDANLPHSYFVDGILQAQQAGATDIAFREEDLFNSGKSRKEISDNFEAIQDRLLECAQQEVPITNLTLVAAGTISVKNMERSISGLDGVEALLSQLTTINTTVRQSATPLYGTTEEVLPIDHVILDIYIDHTDTAPDSHATNIETVRNALFELFGRSPLPFDLDIRMSGDVALLVTA